MRRPRVRRGRRRDKQFRRLRGPKSKQDCRRGKMKSNGYRGNTLAMVAIFLGVCLSAAAANSRTVSVKTAVNLNGTEITPGFYVVEWVTHSPEATVTFTRNGQAVVTAPGKMVERDTKSLSDAVVYSNNADGSHTLKELRFAGKKQVLVFGEL